MAAAFNAVIQLRGINPYVLVGAARAKALKPGWRKPLPVLMRINGLPKEAVRTNLMPVGDGSFYLYLHGEARRLSQTQVGERVHVTVELDASYRNGPQHRMPAWFARALAGAPRAKKSWAALIPSRKKEILRYFSRLRSEAARSRNLARALEVLSGGTGRFMARAWKNGS
jgi:hypothetical protein